MECFNCKSSYDETLNPPHFLIECGHSICFRCLSANFQNQMFICPECKTPNRAPSVASFPKNLALLYVKPTTKGDKSARSSLRPESSVQFSKEATALCFKHSKNLEAFCENDRQLLCIACVLQDTYKDKLICTIQEAADKERDLLSRAFQVSKLAEDRLKQLHHTILDAQKFLNAEALKYENQITLFFEEVKRIVYERETLLKRQVHEKLRQEEEIIAGKENTVASFFHDIISFDSDYQQSLREDDLTLLSSSIRRLELIKKITSDPEDFEFNIPFTDLDKDQELRSLIDSLAQLDGKQGQTFQFKLDSIVIPTIPEKIDITPKARSQTTKEYSYDFELPVHLPSRSQIIDIAPMLSSKKFATSRDNSCMRQNLVSPRNNRTFEQKRGEKATKLKKILVNVGAPEKRSAVTPNNLSRQEEIYEKIPVLDQPDADAYVQKPYTSICLDRSEKSSLNASKILRRDMQTPKISTSIATIDLAAADLLKGVKTPFNEVTNTSRVFEFSTHRKRSPWRIEHHPENKENNNTRNLPTETLLMTNKTSDIKMPERTSYSSFQTNEEILDMLAPNTYLTTDPRYCSIQDNFPRKSPSNLQRSEFFTSSKKEHHLGLTHQKSSETLLHSPTISLSYRESISQNHSILPRDINFPSILHTETKSRILTRKASDATVLTVNKLDISAMCQNISSFVYVIGGSSESSQLSVDRLDLQKGRWEIGGNLPARRRKFSAVVLPRTGNILIMGGKEEVGKTKTCLEYIIAENKFKRSNICLTCPKSGFGALRIQDEIYVCGGNNEKETLRSFESYNLITKKWRALPPPKTKRHEHSLAFGPDQKIYSIGGASGHNNQPLNTVERYDPETQRWEDVAPLNIPRTGLSVVTLPDGIYAIGGYDGTRYLNTVEKYDDNENAWVFVGSMNYAKCRTAAVVSSDLRSIYSFGGFNNGAMSTVEQYSVLTDKWEVIDSMRNKKSMHCAVLISK